MLHHLRDRATIEAELARSLTLTHAAHQNRATNQFVCFQTMHLMLTNRITGTP